MTASTTAPGRRRRAMGVRGRILTVGAAGMAADLRTTVGRFSY